MSWNPLKNKSTISKKIKYISSTSKGVYNIDELILKIRENFSLIIMSLSEINLPYCSMVFSLWQN
jgi:hypothetical protein